MGKVSEWTDAEKALLRKVWPVHTQSELVAMFPDRPWGGIAYMAEKMRLRKDPAHIHKVKSEASKRAVANGRKQTVTKEMREAEEEARIEAAERRKREKLLSNIVPIALQSRTELERAWQ